ncbi:MAG: malonyl-CoA decarboxylase domain-containing protein [Chthoniobacterales bacterium]
MFEAVRRTRASVGQTNLLRDLVKDCDRLLGAAGDSISLSLADQAIVRFGHLDAVHREEFYDRLAVGYNPEPKAVMAAAKTYEATGSPEDLVRLTAASEAPRQELFRRLNRATHGTACLVQMRREILSNRKKRGQLAAADHDLQHLLSSWFNPGFLQLQRIDWNSPASLLEKVIKHEAVHAIDGWADLRRRMEEDRRLFAYFHPALPGEPLIFVEVALVPEMPRAIGPLLERQSAPDAQARNYKVATFYSISNCQPGLKGVNLGNFLIKRVVEALRAELPQLQRFCTLSPVPSFASFLNARGPISTEVLEPAKARSVEKLRETVAPALAAAGPGPLPEKMVKDLSRLCAVHLIQSATSGYALADPVARFHLGNGARLKQINPNGGHSAKSWKESYNFMVNYSYGPGEIEANYERFAAGEVVAARRVKALLP